MATKKLLDVAVVKHEAISSNIANVSTPGYKRVALSKTFESQLKQELESGNSKRLERMEPSIQQDPTARTFRVDGNNVQLDQELLELAGNTANFEALSFFASSSLKQLKTAIMGRTM